MNCMYLRGDATKPVASGPVIIVHICNDIGGWGAGFVLAVSKRWKQPETVYRVAFASENPPRLGDVQFVEADVGITVANLIGQHGIRRGTQGLPPIRYDAVRTGLEKIARRALESGASVHMPRIGCGLAGGKWEEIEPIILQTLIASGVPVTVYDF